MKFRPSYLTLWRIEGRRLENLAFSLIWIAYAIFTKAFWFVTDDAFISFRYAKTWAQGNGLRFNIGEHIPVEGYSNFLWVIWCGLIERAGGDIVFWAPLTSFLAGSILLYLIFNALLRRLELDLLSALLTTLSIAAFGPFFVWSTGGLATIPFALAVFITFDQLMLRPGGPAPVLAGIAGLTASLLRAEGLAWALLIGICTALSWRLSSQPMRDALVKYLGILVVGFGLYFAWRYNYYGSLVSNTALAKVSLSLPIIVRGFEYLASFITTFLVPLLLIPAYAIALSKENLAIGLPLTLLSLASFGYAVVVGGDFMAMGRFFVVGLPFNALLFGLLLKWLKENWPQRRLIVDSSAAFVIILALLPMVDFHILPESIRSQFNVRRGFGQYWTEAKYWNFMRINSATWKKEGLAIRELADPADTIVKAAIGNVGYYSELFIYDEVGLVNREVAMAEKRGLGVPGHDSAQPNVFFAKYCPTFMRTMLAPDTSRLEELKKAFDLEREQLWENYGLRYEVVTHIPFQEGAAPPPQTVHSFRHAIILNLQAPFGSAPDLERPRDVLLALRKVDG